MAISDLKRFLVPGALVIGGVTVGSILAPVALASADDDTESSDTESTDTESSDTESEGRHRGWGQRGMRARGMARGLSADVLTDTLGLTQEELRSELSDGKSLADIAAEQDVSADDLKAALLGAAEERIDEAVTEGHIDSERAEDIKAELAERIDEHINRVHDGSMGERGNKEGDNGKWSHRRAHRGMRANAQAGAEALADFLGITTDELREAHQDGQTMADVAEAQGVSEDDLVEFLLAQMQERLDTAVENGKLDTDQVDDILAAAEARIEERINGEMGQGRGRGQHWHRHSHDGDA